MITRKTLFAAAMMAAISGPAMAAPDYYINIERGFCRRHPAAIKRHETLEHCARRMEKIDRALAEETK